MIALLIIPIVLGIMIADTVDPDFVPDPVPTVEDRSKYNTGFMADECVFDDQGAPINKDDGLFGCADYRWINSSIHARKPGMHVVGAWGRYVEPATPDPAIVESIEIPEDVTVVWYPTLSELEVSCWHLQKDRGAKFPQYVFGCYDPSFKMVHVVNGDWMVLQHELMHYTDGDFHGDNGQLEAYNPKHFALASSLRVQMPPHRRLFSGFEQSLPWYIFQFKIASQAPS